MPDRGDSTLIEILLVARDQLSGVFAEAAKQAKELRGSLNEVKRTLDQASGAFEYTTTATGAFTWATEEADDAVKELTLQTTLLNAALALAGKYALDAAVDMTFLAGRGKELEIIVERLGHTHGISTEELAAYREKIEEVGIAQVDTLQVMARFIGMQLELTDAVKLAAAAQDIATIGGHDTSEALTNITYALGSLHPRILRQYQIYVDLNKIKAETADLLDREIVALTDAEIRWGMLNAVLEAAAPYVGLYEEAMKTASKQTRTLVGRDIRDLKTEIGGEGGLQSMFLGLVTILRDFVGLLEDLPDPIQNLIGLLIGWSGATVALWKGLGLLGATIAGPLVGAVVLLTGAVAAAVGAFKDFQSDIDAFRKGAIEAAREQGLSWEELRAIMEDYYESLSLREKIAWQLAGGFEQQMRIMKLEWRGLQQTVEEATDAMSDAVDTMTKEMQDALDDLRPTAKLFRLDIDDLAEQLEFLESEFISNAEAARDLESIILSLALPTRRAVEVMRMLGISSVTAEGALKDPAQFMAEFAAATAGAQDITRISMLEALVGRAALPEAAAMAGIGGFGGFGGGAWQSIGQADISGLFGQVKTADGVGMVVSENTAALEKATEATEGLADVIADVYLPLPGLKPWAGGGAGGGGGGGGGAGGVGGLSPWMRPFDPENPFALAPNRSFSSGGKVVIEIPVILNNREITRVVVDDLGQAARRRGR